MTNDKTDTRQSRNAGPSNTNPRTPTNVTKFPGKRRPTHAGVATDRRLSPELQAKLEALAVKSANEHAVTCVSQDRRFEPCGLEPDRRLSPELQAKLEALAVKSANEHAVTCVSQDRRFEPCGLEPDLEPARHWLDGQDSDLAATLGQDRTQALRHFAEHRAARLTELHESLHAKDSRVIKQAILAGKHLLCVLYPNATPDALMEACDTTFRGAMGVAPVVGLLARSIGPGSWKEPNPLALQVASVVARDVYTSKEPTEPLAPAVELTDTERADLRARGRAEASRRFMVNAGYGMVTPYPEDARRFVCDTPEGPYLERIGKAQVFADAYNERYQQLYSAMGIGTPLADGQEQALGDIAEGRHALNIACGMPAKELADRVAVALENLPADSYKTEALGWSAVWLAPEMRPSLRVLVALAGALEAA